MLPLAAAFAALVTAASCSTMRGHRYVEVLSDTSRVSCWGSSPGAPFGPRFAQSPVVVSPDRQFQAYAVVEALAEDTNDPDRRTCHNVSRLYVSGPSNHFENVFTQNPTAEGENGNSLSIVDWAPDGRTLLLRMPTWTYHTEENPPLILLYDALAHRVTQVDIDGLLRGKYAKKCSVWREPEGFTPEGHLVIRTSPAGDRLYGPDCIDHDVLWIYHPESSSIEALPPSYQVVRYGSMVE